MYHYQFDFSAARSEASVFSTCGLFHATLPLHGTFHAYRFHAKQNQKGNDQKYLYVFGESPYIFNDILLQCKNRNFWERITSYIYFYVNFNIAAVDAICISYLLFIATDLSHV